MSLLLPTPTSDSMPSAKSIAVFLGANVGNDSKFEKMAQEVASLFVENGWKLGEL